MQGFGLGPYLEGFTAAQVCLVLWKESPHNLSDLQFRENFCERPNQIKFLPLGCRFEVRIIIVKVRGVSIWNISVSFALSHSDAMLVCWEGVSACRYGIPSPGQGLCLCQKGSAEISVLRPAISEPLSAEHLLMWLRLEFIISWVFYRQNQGMAAIVPINLVLSGTA